MEEIYNCIGELVKDLLGKDVEMILDTRIFVKEGHAPYSLEAKGHVYEHQNPYTDFLIFDKLIYKMYKSNGRVKKIELENAVVKKLSIACIGIPKKNHEHKEIKLSGEGKAV